MQTKLLSITAGIFFIVLLAACKKDNDGPKIGFKLKSLNKTTFNRGENVVFRFEYTPKSGKQDTLFVKKEFYTCPYNTLDSLAFEFPADYPDDTKGELEFAFVYSSPISGPFFEGCYNVTPTARRTDSLHYTFWIKDEGGNVSDTVRSPKIILLKD